LAVHSDLFVMAYWRDKQTDIEQSVHGTYTDTLHSSSRLYWRNVMRGIARHFSAACTGKQVRADETDWWCRVELRQSWPRLNRPSSHQPDSDYWYTVAIAVGRIKITLLWRGEGRVIKHQPRQTDWRRAHSASACWQRVDNARSAAAAEAAGWLSSESESLHGVL